MQIHRRIQNGRPELLVVRHLLNKNLVAVFEAVDAAVGVARVALPAIEVANIMMHARFVDFVDWVLIVLNVRRVVGFN